MNLRSIGEISHKPLFLCLLEGDDGWSESIKAEKEERRKESRLRSTSEIFCNRYLLSASLYWCKFTYVHPKCFEEPERLIKKMLREDRLIQA